MKYAAELALINIDIECSKESRVELDYVTLLDCGCVNTNLRSVLQLWVDASESLTKIPP